MRLRNVLAVTLLLLTGCGPAIYYVRPPDWRDESRRDSTIAYYANYIHGWKFYVDPGHGGADRFNHGPDYDAIEADLNLRVSLTLADYLRRAGATVYLSRTKDTTVDLTDRPKFSNASGADIFISVHHNATGDPHDLWTNFTSVWYHAYPENREYNACNQDIARYLQRDLAYAMGNPGSPSSFDGTMSDYAIYPGAGFAVLRLASIPAVLIEGSFFSSAYEEQRLVVEQFNEIEAWGIFKGIGRYLRDGIPKLRMVSDTLTASHRPTLVFEAFDSSGIAPRSIYVWVDGKEIPAQFNPDSGRIIAALPFDLSNGTHEIEALVRNNRGNANFPCRPRLVVMPPVDSLVIAALPREIPPDATAPSSVSVEAYDAKGDPCTDGTPLLLSASGGFLPDTVWLKSARAQAYFVPNSDTGTAVIRVTASGHSAETTVRKAHGLGRYITGSVRSSADSSVLGDAIVVIHRDFPTPFALPPATRTLDDGRFIATTDLIDTLHADVGRMGYFGTPITLPLAGEITTTSVSLTPVARGVLHDKIFVLDARFGGPDTGPIARAGGAEIRTSDVNLEVAHRLQQLLTAAGARVLQVRKHDIELSDDMRLQYIETVRNGLYIGINAVDTAGRCGVFLDPTVARSQVGSSLLWGMCSTLGRDSAETRSGRTPLTDGIPFGALMVLLPSVSDSLYARNVRYTASEEAWGIYRGILRAYGFAENPLSTFITPPGSFPPYQAVVLDDALPAVTGPDGSAVFYGTDGSARRVHLLDE